MPYVSTKTLQQLSKKLLPAEIAVYLAAQCLEESKDKLTKKRIERVLGSNAATTMKKMIRRGTLPKGRITMQAFEEQIHKPARPTLNPAGRLIVSELAKVVKSHGGKCDSSWWGKQIVYCSSLINKKDVTVDEWIRVIKWAKQKQLRYVVGAYQLPHLRERYHIDQKSRAFSARSPETSKDLWKGVVY